ncbi:hypothetical protein GCM10027168_61700 [Streptomyces capparidis]
MLLGLALVVLRALPLVLFSFALTHGALLRTARASWTRTAAYPGETVENGSARTRRGPPECGPWVRAEPRGGRPVRQRSDATGCGPSVWTR